MPKNSMGPQALKPEPRSETVSLAVTEREKRAIGAIALLNETDVSNLLRTTTIPEIVADFDRLQAAKGAA